MHLVPKFFSRAVCSLFSNSLVSVGLSSGLFLVLEYSLVSFERFASFLNDSSSLVSFAWFALCSQTRQSFSSGLLFVKFFSPFRAVCSLLQILSSLSNALFLFLILWSGLLLVLKFPSRFRAVCSLFSTSLVSFERFAPGSQIA